eukprot:gene10433-2564_t
MDGGGGGGGGRDRSTFDDDLFRCVDAMEVNAIEASAAEGARDGERQGRLEGEHAGIQAGFMIGLEIGFYKASIETWSNLRPDISKSKRFQTQVSKLSEAIQRLQSLKAGDHEIDNALSGMRSSYTLIKIPLYYLEIKLLVSFDFEDFNICSSCSMT